MPKPEDGSMKKTNGPEIDPKQRLASFKPPRDFTLGCSNAKPNKKIFTPNLNVARNKKGTVSGNVIDHKNNAKTHKDQRRDGNKNFKNAPKVIKAKGIFSEGLGSIERQSTKVYYGREKESTQTIKRTSLRLKDFAKNDQTPAGKPFENSMETLDDSEDLEYIQEKDEPVKLPMCDGGWLYSEPKPAIIVKQDMFIKTEPIDEASQSELLERKPFSRVKDEVYDETDVANVLSREQPTLLLLQLPDSMPARGGSAEEPKIKNKPTTSADEDAKEELPVDNKCKLSDLEEGQIGKLRIHRSGRVTLILGDTLFEVCSGTKPAFYQEAVSVKKEDDSRSATMTSLGPIHHKLNLIPNWEHMFCHMAL